MKKITSELNIKKFSESYKMSNEEIYPRLNHDVISLIHSYLTLNEQKEASMISRDFYQEANKRLRFQKEKDSAMVKIYSISSKNRVFIINDSLSKNNKELLQKLADLYGSFTLFPIEKTKYNLLRFDNIPSSILDNIRAYIRRFYKLSNILPTYLSYKIEDHSTIFSQLLITSSNKTQIIYEIDNQKIKFEINHMFKKDDKLTKISFKDDYITRELFFNENILIYFVIIDKLIKHKVYLIKKFKKDIEVKNINFYSFNNIFFILEYLFLDGKRIIFCNHNFWYLKNEYVLIDGFVFNLNDRSFKYQGYFDNKYIFDMNSLKTVEISKNLYILDN